ncbi:MAG TPA: GNAT family N-acetyltransferase [bacterium]|nr:GNAT family N-acetyltransferase [bacterium]
MSKPEAEVRILQTGDDAALRAFVGACDQATIYHTPEWRDALISTYGYTPMYLGLFAAEKLTALLPLMFVRSWLTGNRLVSLPFSNTCGPIGPSEYTRPLLDEALSLRARLKAKAVELRTQANLNPVTDARFSSVTYFITSLVKLASDPQDVWENFKDRNVRTEVRQAAKKGIEVRDGADLRDLEDFYRLFAGLRLKHGVPPQPYKFFENLWKHLWPEYLHLHVATYQGEHVASLVTLGFGKTLAAAYIGSNPAYRSYRVHQILFWKAMERGCLKGHEVFDFLRTPKASQELRYFKDRWNALEIDLAYLYYPQVCGTASTIEESAKYKLMTSVLKRAPDGVGKAIGRALYKHLG